MSFNYSYNISKAQELNGDIWNLDLMKGAIQGKNTELNNSCQALEIGLISTAVTNIEGEIAKASASLTALIGNISSIAAQIEKEQEAALAAAAAASAAAAKAAH